MSIERVGRAEKEQKAEQAREEERRRELQATDNRAAEHITAVRVQETKPTTGEERTTQAVNDASRHNADRGADWQAYAERAQTTVPVSVTELANQSNAQASRAEQDSKATRVGETEQSKEARHDVQREAVRRQAEQQMTVAEIQADMMKKSGIVRG